MSEAVNARNLERLEEIEIRRKELMLMQNNVIVSHQKEELSKTPKLMQCNGPRPMCHLILLFITLCMLPAAYLIDSLSNVEIGESSAAPEKPLVKLVFSYESWSRTNYVYNPETATNIPINYQYSSVNPIEVQIKSAGTLLSYCFIGSSISTFLSLFLGCSTITNKCKILILVLTNCAAVGSCIATALWLLQGHSNLMIIHPNVQFGYSIYFIAGTGMIQLLSVYFIALWVKTELDQSVYD
jgi:hypothetical protein